MAQGSGQLAQLRQRNVDLEAENAQLRLALAEANQQLVAAGLAVPEGVAPAGAGDLDCDV